MTTDQFVEAVKIQTSDAAVTGTIACLKRPPGRKPREKDVRLSEWYNRLHTLDQQMLQQALREATELAVFEFFCVLDGVTVIEDTREKGALELDYVKGSERTRLNPTEGEELHNIFNEMCEAIVPGPIENPEIAPGDSGEARQLKGKLRPGDEMDIHHVPDKHQASTTLRSYDPESAPAIALRKPEHRKISSCR
jgi:hypothetical protein